MIVWPIGQLYVLMADETTEKWQMNLIGVMWPQEGLKTVIR